MDDARATPNETITLPPGMGLRGSLPAGASAILTPAALALVADLTRAFRGRIDELLERRRTRQARLDAGERPHFLTETQEIRDTAWTAAPPPADLLDRRVELTGPPDRETILRGLDSGASVFVADFEDAFSPTWRSVIEGQQNLRDAVDGAIAVAPPGGGPTLRPGGRPAVLMVRPRGWQLAERHALVDGRAVPASLWDTGIFLAACAPALVARGSGPYLVLPKLEGHLEARLWNELFLMAQERLGLPRGTIRATCLVETLPAAFEMDEILWELREHSAGLACGREGYAFSVVKRLRSDPRMVLPDRALVTADGGLLRACARLLVQTCHRRGVHALGGRAALLPIDGGGAAHDAAIARLRADALRDVREGLDGTWVAHPSLVPVARAVFDVHLPGPNQIERSREEVRVTPRDLLAPAEGARTEAGLRLGIRTSVRYLESWLRGAGCVALYQTVEDAATAELCRALAWQWIHHGVLLDGRDRLTVERFRTALAEEMDRIRLEVGEARFTGGRFDEARALFERVSTQEEFLEFLTPAAYELLEAAGGDRVTGGATALPPELSVAPPHPDPRRWEGILRTHGREQVERLRGTVRIEHTLARLGAERLWELLRTRPHVPALGALTGGQAVQMVRAGLEAIYVSGWQVAADGNLAGQTYPDQSLYPADSVPTLVRRINRALQRADEIEHAEGRGGRAWYAPIVADAEAGFGGPLNAFELMKAMIEAGAAGVHFEDQVSTEKKCGHLGGKVLVPTATFLRTLAAARLAADVLGVPTVLIARTDAESAKLIMSDVDPADAPFIEPGERTPEGFHRLRGGVDCAIHRGLAYAPYADLIWCETGTPDLREARRFAEGIHDRFPGKLLAYNCSPSFNWRKNLDDATIATFQRELGAMGYRFQFVTLAGFHSLNHGMFELARGYRELGMAAYTELQEAEFDAERRGYTATRHQREVGTGYFDLVAQTVAGGAASTLALEGSTEAAQFTAAGPVGATHAAHQVRRALDEDHGRLEELTGRLAAAEDGAALTAALEELARMLTEHFAHEEHAKGFYGILSARGPEFRLQTGRMVAEHRQLLRDLGGLVARSKAQPPAPATELGKAAASLSARLEEHEARELTLANALA